MRKCDGRFSQQRFGCVWTVCVFQNTSNTCDCDGERRGALASVTINKGVTMIATVSTRAADARVRINYFLRQFDAFSTDAIATLRN